MNNPSKEKTTFFKTALVFVLTILTIALLFVTFSEGGWWTLATILWLPPFYLVTAMLGHPAKGDKGGNGPDPTNI